MWPWLGYGKAKTWPLYALFSISLSLGSQLNNYWVQQLSNLELSQEESCMSCYLVNPICRKRYATRHFQRKKKLYYIKLNVINKKILVGTRLCVPCHLFNFKSYGIFLLSIILIPHINTHNLSQLFCVDRRQLFVQHYHYQMSS